MYAITLLIILHVFILLIELSKLKMRSCQLAMLYFVLLTSVNTCIASALIDMHDWYIQPYFPTIMAKFSSRCSGYSHCVWCNKQRICYSLWCLHSSYWKFVKFDINTLGENECYTELWFFKRDLDKLLGCLGIPEKIPYEQKIVCSGLDGLCT